MLRVRDWATQESIPFKIVRTSSHEKLGDLKEFVACPGTGSRLASILSASAIFLTTEWVRCTADQPGEALCAALQN